MCLPPVTLKPGKPIHLIRLPLICQDLSGGAVVKNLSTQAMQEIQVWSLGLEGSLEKEIATHSSILAWRMPWTEEPGGLQSMEPQRVRHDWAHTHVHIHVNMLWWLTEFQIFYSHLPAKCIGPLTLWVTVTESISFTSVYCSIVWRNKIFKDIKADFRQLLVVQWSLLPSFESK